jgi:hypothetical protein
MKNINFIACGQIGDLIHSLYVVKSMCYRDNCKANFFIADNSYINTISACGNFTFDLNKTYEDMFDLMKHQDYVENFDILPRNYNDTLVNLNSWRDYIEVIRNSTGSYSKCWTELMLNFSNIDKIEGPWISAGEDEFTKNKVLIHNSTHRFNPSFNLHTLINQIDDEILFITTSEQDWNSFRFHNERIKPYFRKNINELASSINSCKYFIGNQSSPFAIASALNKDRFVELYSGSQGFYMDERNYYDNISWFFETNNYFLGKNTYNFNL